MLNSNKNNLSRPNFAEIKSLKMAQVLCRKGQLEKLFLMPLEFGGQDIPNNIVYVPIGVAKIKQNIDLNIIRELIKEGKASEYSASPKYLSDSFIPNSIEVSASKPGNFTSNISIWGEKPIVPEKKKNSPIQNLKFKNATEYNLSTPENTVKEFISEYEKWNNWAITLNTAEESIIENISLQYEKLIRNLCLHEVEPQPSAFGSDSAHSLIKEKLLKKRSNEKIAIISTESKDEANFITNYEYHLVLSNNKWLIKSLLYVCEDGKYECL